MGGFLFKTLTKAVPLQRGDGKPHSPSITITLANGAITGAVLFELVGLPEVITAPRRRYGFHTAVLSHRTHCAGFTTRPANKITSSSNSNGSVEIIKGHSETN